MIGELLRQTGQISSSPPSSLLRLDALALGTGPSFYEWIKHPLPAGKRYGCGVSSLYLRLDAYAYGDAIHESHLPTNDFHPGVEIHGTDRVWRPGLILWDDAIPHGGSSGGMALSLACATHQRIGVIGFDGHQMPDEFVARFRDLLRYWQSRGKELVSLMPSSVFDDVLAKA